MIAHEMLIANAGSGKTYRLTVRTIMLLARGAKPDKIAALTFTRKAAGEFLETVFRRLADAAIDPEKLAKLCQDTECPTLDADRCREILASLVKHLHRLNMGTIDSLFGKIARSFPLECGLAGDFSVISEIDQTAAHRDVLATLFRENVGDVKKFAAFLELIRLQSLQQSEREIFKTLLKETKGLHGKFLRHQIAGHWGHRDSIWPDGSDLFLKGDHSSAAETLLAAILQSHPELDPKVAELWDEYLDETRAHVEGQNWSKPLEDFIAKKLATHTTDKKDGRLYLPHGNGEKFRIYLHDEVLSARRVLLLCLLRPKIERLLERSRSLHALMDQFEEIYADRIRRQGRITFEDITLALAEQVDSPDWLATVGYRLDTRFDHWLLDEFQDTSRPQWKVLGALIDEVVQDPGGERSFFYVGDTKQAIYGWRGGDPKLFFEIRDRYNQGKDLPITAAPPLKVSFRSDPEIIEIVNTVFGNLAAVEEPLKLPRAAVADWEQAWVTHEVVENRQAQSGYVRWTAVDLKGAVEDDSLDAIDLEIVTILEEIRPWERGWSCAALKRDNKKLVLLSALLQSRGIPVTAEGKSNPCIDNPLAASVLAAFRRIASPNDALSLALLASSRLGGILLAKGDFELRKTTLQQIARTGFAATIDGWIDQLDLHDEPFLAARAADLRVAAELFDVGRRSSDDLGSFIHFLENYEIQEPEGSHSVRLMTIHQAKGLTLDLVILSGLDTLAKADGSIKLSIHANRHQENWGMLLPKTDFCQHDDVLCAASNAILAESAYGELCAAYVAMTRPRHGLYLVTEKLAEKTTAKSFARLLHLTLGQTFPFFEKGNRQWFEAKCQTAPPVASPDRSLKWVPPLDTTPRAIFPSSLHHTNGKNSPAETVFFADAQALGTEIHAFLAQIETLQDVPSMDGLSPAAVGIVRPFLDSALAREVFGNVPPPDAIWRERAFDITIDGAWITGVFDRVHLALDASGRPVSAVVFDFKTDPRSAEELAEIYEKPLELYRSAAARLLGLPLAAVTTRLISLR